MQGASSVQGTTKQQGLALRTPVQANANQKGYTSRSLRGAESRAKTGKWAKYPIELLPRAYVSKSPDAPRLVSTPRAHLPYPGKARPDVTSDLLIVARPILDFANQLPKTFPK